MNSNNNYFINYDFKSEGISLLSQEQQNFYISSIKNHLNNTINDYSSKKLNEQDNILLGINEDTLLNNKNQKNFVSHIQKLIETIEESDNYNYIKNQNLELNETNQGIYNMTYKEICAFANYIIIISKSLSKKKREKLYNFLFSEEQNTFDKKELKELDSSKLEKMIIVTNLIKQINICISEKNVNILEKKQRNEINLFAIRLFMIFFKAFFKNVLTLNIDLNIYEINNYFCKECNPYKIKEEKIVKLYKFYEDIILSNLIIINNLSQLTRVSNIKFILYDSYQIEMYHILVKNFSKKLENQDKNNIDNNKNNTNKNKEEVIHDFTNKILFFDQLIQKQIKEYFDFNMEINALDPLLFLKVNLLIHKYKSVINTTINFFNLEKINLRKTLLNAYYFFLYITEKGKEKYTKKEKEKINPLQIKFYPNNINSNFLIDYKIYYNYINNINKYTTELLLRDEEILNELFPYFNYNLNLLFFVLMEKFGQLNSLALDFRLVNDNIFNIHSYNNYNFAILSFIFNLFQEIENNKKLENICLLDIYLDDLNEQKEYIIQYIFNNFRKNIPFNFSKINLTAFKLDFPNITSILPFNNFPVNRLNNLILQNLTINDLKNIAESLVKNKSMFNKLSIFDISIGFMFEDYKKYLKVLLTEKIGKRLLNYKLKIPFYISFGDIVDIFSWIKRGENKKAAYFLKLSNEYLSMHLGKFSLISSFKNMLKQIKNKLHRLNFIANFNYNNLDKISILIKMLNKEEINYYLKIIFCFNKIYGKNNDKNISEENRQKIFENIFYYIGKFSTKYKEINLEII